MIKELDYQDESPHVNMSETKEEVQDKSLAFDNDLNFDTDNVKIEEGVHIFMAMVHPVNPQLNILFMLQAQCPDTWLKLSQRPQSQRDFVKLSPQHFTPMKMCSVKQLLTLFFENGIMP
jgi:hypothetical protein